MVGVGISFGCSTAAVAVCREGRSEVIANSAGDRATSTVVALLEGEILTGTPALQAQLRQPAQAVTQLKRLLGGELPAANQACKLEERKGEVVVNFTDTAKGVSQLAKGVFENLKETADSALGEGTHDTVISIPPACSPQYTNTLRLCASSAGFNVLGTISEPISALSTHSSIGSGLVLVVRVGGYSSSLTLVRCMAGMYSVLDHSETATGGHDIDVAVGAFLSTEFNRKYKCKVEENARSAGKIERAAKAAKHALSTQNTTEYNIESLFDGMDHIGSLSRPRFETLIQAPITRLQESISAFAAKHSLATELNTVVLCGGSSKIPRVQALLRSFFPACSLLCETPDEVAALGAAEHAFQLASQPGLLKETSPEDGTVGVAFTPADLVAEAGDQQVVVVERGVALPCKREVTLPEGKEVVLKCGQTMLARVEVMSGDGGVLLGLDVAEDGSIEGVIRDDNDRMTFSIPS